MTTKEMIQAEIEKLSEDDLQKLYQIARELAERGTGRPRESLMSRLRNIQFDAPEDLSVSHDLYVSGEKRADQDLR
ncbi:MAG: hypothetical protein U0Z53_08980 [Blastocatellia bacterium]